MAKRPFVRVCYQADPAPYDPDTGASTPGAMYRVKVAADLAAEPGLGWIVDDVTKPTLPRGLQMRYVLAKTADGTQTRRLHCGSIGASAFVTPGATLVLDVFNEAADTTFVRTGKVGEQVTD
jgi:hypothetical protein